MADRSTKPISEVAVGDMVMAADPETGERGPRRVTDTIVGEGVKELVDIEVDGHVVTATDHHPFWVDDEGRWVDAEDLEAGDVLLLPDGETATVDGVREHTEIRRVHNLTVDGIHTYYVLVGDDPILVHNCARPGGPTDARAVLAPTGSSDVVPINGRMPINSGYAGATHPSGVSFTSQGFPDFSPYVPDGGTVTSGQLLTGDVATDLATLGRGSAPEGFTWHHAEDGFTMQQVPTEVHQLVRHTGGAAVSSNLASNLFTWMAGRT